MNTDKRQLSDYFGNIFIYEMNELFDINNQLIEQPIHLLDLLTILNIIDDLVTSRDEQYEDYEYHALFYLYYYFEYVNKKPSFSTMIRFYKYNKKSIIDFIYMIMKHEDRTFVDNLILIFRGTNTIKQCRLSNIDDDTCESCQ